jgi:hypothetical protein
MIRWLYLLLAFVLVLDIQDSHACPNSPDDEEIIEYFNQIEFSMDIYVTITDTGTEFQVQLSCPPQQSPYFPPANFLLTMADTTNSLPPITCNTGTFTLNKIDMKSLSFCQNNGETCSFLITASNQETKATYCTTDIMITFTNGNYTYIPNLQPATLPLCPSNFNPCMLTGQCSLSSNKTGNFRLCDSSNLCTTPPNNSSYSYNENVYFSTNIGKTLRSQP